MFGVNTLFSVWLAIMLVNYTMSGAMNVMGAGLNAMGSTISAVAPKATQMASDKLQESGINRTICKTNWKLRCVRPANLNCSRKTCSRMRKMRRTARRTGAGHG